MIFQPELPSLNLLTKKYQTNSDCVPFYKITRPYSEKMTRSSKTKESRETVSD